MAGSVIASADLVDLVTLDRRRLHVFVAGPGYGEGIAVALPDRGWLLVDGCEVERRIPLLSILDRWRGPDDPIDCLALTHPHKDHAGGFRRVLETTTPSYVALTAPADDPAEALRAGRPEHESTTGQALRSSTVVHAMAAIQRFRDRRPDRLIGLCAGTVIPTTSSLVDVVARSPQPAMITAALVHARLGYEFADPNELSAIFEIRFGETRIVLGSDLTTPGWTAALTGCPQLGDHHGLKVPHHGSRTGRHPDVMTPGAGRAWIVAPFSPSHLPPVHEEGLPWLVERGGRVLVTAAPIARKRQPFPRAEVAIGQVADLFATGAPPGKGAVAVSPPSGLQALDAVWAASFDAGGGVQGLWRGPRAFAVVP